MWAPLLILAPWCRIQAGGRTQAGIRDPGSARSQLWDFGTFGLLEFGIWDLGFKKWAPGDRTQDTVIKSQNTAS